MRNSTFETMNRDNSISKSICNLGGQAKEYLASMLDNNVMKTLKGMYRYHLYRRKKVVLICAPMRTGTTLLKALLAESSEISHLPEIDFFRFANMNRYAAYNEIYELSEKPIIVLKRPPEIMDWQRMRTQQYTIPFRRKFLPLKIIIIKRNPYDTVRSLQRMTQHLTGNPWKSQWTTYQAVNYWISTYRNLFTNPSVNEHDVTTVSYEELTNEPEITTEKLFHFIGTKESNGVRTYRKPEDPWRWGQDDAGDAIYTLHTQPRKHAEPSDEIYEELSRDSFGLTVMKLLGYSNERELRSKNPPDTDNMLNSGGG